MSRIILASGSPRRRELLAGLDVDFTVDTGNSFEESADPAVPAAEVPVLMARGKSLGFHRPLEDDEVLLTADTVVLVSPDGSFGPDSAVLGKPHSREQAMSMLRDLSGRTHKVITAVMMRSNFRSVEFTDSTLVTFEPLNDSDIAYYVDKYRPYDKAGAYGVQEWIGYACISGIDGSFYNVMGFPVHKVYRELKSFI